LLTVDHALPLLTGGYVTQKRVREAAGHSNLMRGSITP
jgi:hypothetical protein